MKEETKTKRTKKSANYVLQQVKDWTKEKNLFPPNDEEDFPTETLWIDLQDGFISPEKALEFAEEKQIEGKLRVVRAATPIFGGMIVTKYVLDKAGKKRSRKPREKKVVFEKQDGDTTIELLDMRPIPISYQVETDPIPAANDFDDSDTN